MCFKLKCFECFLNKLYCEVENFTLTTAEKKKKNSSDIFTLFYSRIPASHTELSFTHLSRSTQRDGESSAILPVPESQLSTGKMWVAPDSFAHVHNGLSFCHSLWHLTTNRLMSDHLIWPHCEVKSQINPFHPSGLIHTGT